MPVHIAITPHGEELGRQKQCFRTGYEAGLWHGWIKPSPPAQKPIVGQIGGKFRHRKAALQGQLVQVQLQSEAFAVSTNLEKAAGSFTAISASTLRFRVIPAFLRPFIKRL